MYSLDPEQTRLLIDYCLGVCSPAEAQKAEELIAQCDGAADLHAQVQAALAFLSYLPAEPCPEYLADLTIGRLRRLAAQRVSAQWPRSRAIRIGPRERFRRVAAIAAVAASIVVFTGVLIPFLSSTTPYTPAQRPPEQPERASVHGGDRDSDYAWLPILNEWEATGFVPEVSGLFPGVPGPASYSPRWMDEVIEVGPRALPTLWNPGVEQSSRDGRVGSSPLVLSGESR